MADIPAAAAASPGRFLPHSATLAPVAAAAQMQVATVVAGIHKQWKRGRDISSPPARRAAGGATAPTTVSVNTPPARRQRIVSFNLTGADIDAKLESFRVQVIEEFVRVHNGLDQLHASSTEATNHHVFEAEIDRIDQQFQRSDGMMAGIAANAQQIADGFAKA